MRKIFCDRCGGQCINITVTLRADIAHHTSNFEYVGDDEYKPVELCRNCWSEIEEVLVPLQLTIRMKMDTPENMQMTINEQAMISGPTVHATAQEIPHD